MVNPYRIYDTFDITRAFLYIGDAGIIDRKTLADRVDVGEGIIRSIITELRHADLVDIKKKGVFLTEYGQSLHISMREIVSPSRPIDIDILMDGFYQYIVIMKEYDRDKLGYLYKGRDYAIRQGCMGAMILQTGKSHVYLAGNRRYVFDDLLNLGIFEPGDIILLVSARERRKAENGLLAISLFLNDILHAYHQTINMRVGEITV